MYSLSFPKISCSLSIYFIRAIYAADHLAHCTYFSFKLVSKSVKLNLAVSNFLEELSIIDEQVPIKVYNLFFLSSKDFFWAESILSLLSQAA